MAQIELKEFDPSDWPICWSWLLDAWRHVADDFSPRELDAFIELNHRQGSINMGVYRNGEIGGLLVYTRQVISLPVGDYVSPVVIRGDCVFRRSFFGHENTIPALELGKKFAWEMGFQTITCEPFEDNRLMIRLLKAVGGVYQATFRNHTQQEGKLINVVSYGLFRYPPPVNQQTEVALCQW